MSPWIAGRGVISSESTWLPEEVELAPDWVQEEVTCLPEECRVWLESQMPPSSGASPKGGRGRRGRRKKSED